MRYFVYINGLRGPEPQIWYEKLTVGGKPVEVLKSVVMTEKDPNSIAYLMEKYPYAPT